MAGFQYMTLCMVYIGYIVRPDCGKVDLGRGVGGGGAGGWTHLSLLDQVANACIAENAIWILCFG